MLCRRVCKVLCLFWRQVSGGEPPPPSGLIDLGSAAAPSVLPALRTPVAGRGSYLPL